MWASAFAKQSKALALSEQDPGVLFLYGECHDGVLGVQLKWS